jgi:hypothetical protein
MPLYSDCETFPDLTATFNRFAKVEILSRVAYLVWDTGRQPSPSLRPGKPTLASFAYKWTKLFRW